MSDPGPPPLYIEKPNPDSTIKTKDQNRYKNLDRGVR